MTGDEYIRKIFPPNQTVVKIAVPAILISGSYKWFSLIICIHFLRCAENCRSRVKEQMDVALEMD